MIPLSVLDLSVVTTGTRPAAALRNSIDLARHVDSLGYVRYWLAEHHNLSSVASPAPDLMIGQIAAVTKTIRVGSGGVMLPNDAPLPPIWLLGSSDYSSELAAQVGMGFAFAHHFASYDAVDALTNYRTRFKPSGWRATPHAILAVAAVTADTDAEAERLASSMDLNRLRRDRGQYLPLPSPEEALAYPYTEAERASIARNRSRLFVGSPATVMGKLQPMIDVSQPDELMIITAVYDHEARKKSYNLMADAFGLEKKAAEIGRAH